jgi:hypothetical protein
LYPHLPAEHLWSSFLDKLAIDTVPAGITDLILCANILLGTRVSWDSRFQ